MKRFLSRLFAFTLAVFIGLTGFAADSSAISFGVPDQFMTGSYPDDTKTLVDMMRTAVNAEEGSSDQKSAQADARVAINEYSALYRRDDKLSGLNSYTTIRTALNALAGHYSAYPNRPVPPKLKSRLEKQFKRTELALKRGY